MAPLALSLATLDIWQPTTLLLFVLLQESGVLLLLPAPPAPTVTPMVFVFWMRLKRQFASVTLALLVPTVISV